MDLVKNLSRDDLLKLIEVYAKSWLAHDGCWFLAAEEKYGMDAAMQFAEAFGDRFFFNNAGTVRTIE